MAYQDFKQEINENQDEELWTVVDALDEDENRDDDDFDDADVTLKRSGKTKNLFKDHFMKIVLRFVHRKVKDSFNKNGPFKYR